MPIGNGSQPSASVRRMERSKAIICLGRRQLSGRLNAH